MAKAKVLAVDDSKTIRKAIEITFAKQDFQLVFASSGQEALSKIKQLAPDIVLADHKMPAPNGYDLCKQIKSDPATHHIQVAILCSRKNPFDPQAGKLADAHVVKPFETQALIDLATKLADQATTARAAAPSAPEPAAAAPPEIPTGLERDVDDEDLEEIEITIDEPEIEIEPEPSAPPAQAKPAAPPSAPPAQAKPAAPPSAPPAQAKPAAPPALAQPAAPPWASESKKATSTADAKPPAAAKPVAPPAQAQPTATPKPTAPRFPSLKTSGTQLGTPQKPKAPATPRFPALKPQAPKPTAPPAQVKPAEAPKPAAPPSAPPAQVKPATPPSAPPAQAKPAEAPKPAAAPAEPTATPKPAAQPPQPAAPSQSGESVHEKTTSKAVAQTLERLKSKGPEYEAIANLSKEVIERIVWEVVPDLAEVIIKESLAKHNEQNRS